MKKEFSRIELKLDFKKKRNLQLITPCCHKSNRDGKFVNYKYLPDNYGYCHSCGETTLPDPHYKDENDVEYQWDSLNNCFEPIVLTSKYNSALQMPYNSVRQEHTMVETVAQRLKYIEKTLVLKYNRVKPENNLLKYIRQTYGNEKAEQVKKMYYLGTSKDGGAIFWNINMEHKAQKAKVSYYTIKGKRTDKFKVPYKNEDGYFSCLYGEHLIALEENQGKTIVLVESEKTAIICSIHIPEYIWLSYGGINGLTENKLEVLINNKVILVPDMSENAVAIMKKKLPHLIELGIDAKIWDMTNNESDEKLKEQGWYNCDLEDVFRGFSKVN